MPLDHGDPGDAPSTPPPLTAVVNADRPAPAEEARTVVAATNTATLASLTADGAPWASFVTYGLLDGQPVLCVSRMAEHGRNLAADPRASLSIVSPDLPSDPLAGSRVTLAGKVEQPQGDEAVAAREAHLAAVPAAKYYIDFSDFTLWVMRVERVRWVGGYGRMDSATAEQYSAAAPDTVVSAAARAITHLNDDHADALLAMAQARGGYPDATAAVCERADRYGLDLRVTTPRGIAVTRIGYVAPLDSVAELRAATVELTRLSRAE
ncbi:HugZ family pyridoxamine 5'-phosphate oxidase [Nocardia sp. NBC_01327]|uniref:HugZ family pyridoxamine 5'-phosphate oxidase n=1 Tax=Nocardia sp. NBC_01327 TaxID=2903593 RepID=UPI002E120DD1|nr:pyridoxamine 5'-phosphate oxidase family protein [Nocardia sp. NBC_01327]